MNELPVPGRYLAYPRPQRRVALLQRAVVPGPVIAKVWFHVEHKPVEPPSATFRTLIDELVDLGVDCLNWQDTRELEQ